MLVVALLVVAMATTSNAVVGRHPSYPPVLFSLVWLAVLGLYSVGSSVSGDLPTLSIATLVVVVNGVLCFSAGGFSFFLIDSRKLMCARGQNRCITS